MKWRIAALALVLSLAMTACSNASSEGKAPAASGGGGGTSEERQEAPIPEADTSWFTEDGTAMCSGVYVVGEDIVPNNYIFSCPDEDDAWVIVTTFETKDSYSAYYQSSRFTVGEESEAIAAYASLNDYLGAGESTELNLEEGSVLIVEGGIGCIVATDGAIPERESEVTGNPTVIVDGVYQGGSIQSGTYILINTGDSGLRAVVFPDDAAYEAFENTDHFTSGEWSAAVEKNASNDFYLYEGESYYLNLDKDDVLMVSGDSGVLIPTQMAWAP